MGSVVGLAVNDALFFVANANKFSPPRTAHWFGKSSISSHPLSTIGRGSTKKEPVLSTFIHFAARRWIDNERWLELGRGPEVVRKNNEKAGRKEEVCVEPAGRIVGTEELHDFRFTFFKVV